MGGQFEPKLVVNLHRNWVVNLTVFSIPGTKLMINPEITKKIG